MNFNELYDQLGLLNEALHKQKLLKDLLYNTVDNIIAGDDPIMKHTRVNSDVLLKSFSDNGFIDKDDNIVIPKGTILNYKKTIEPDLYDVYYIQGKRTCYIAVRPENYLELFGDTPYQD